MVRSVLAQILSHGGYIVEAVRTVEAALEIIKTSPPDLLLTNVYLPGITGRDAVRLIKGTLPELPILMVSGLPDNDVIGEWTGKGGFDVFPKPFQSADLLEKVRGMLAP